MTSTDSGRIVKLDPRLDALIPTNVSLDVLADPVAMKAIQSARNGESKYRRLNLDDENFGL